MGPEIFRRAPARLKFPLRDVDPAPETYRLSAGLFRPRYYEGIGRGPGTGYQGAVERSVSGIEAAVPFTT